MFARFFIDKPVFSWVVAIIIMLAGTASILSLPIAQYPDIAPPTVSISANYSGADAQTVENSVTQVLEQQLTGLDGLLYFSSSSSSAGSASISLTFEQGTDADYAQVQVQNKVQQVNSRLPSAVQSEGVTVTKSQSDMLLIAAVYDETNADSEFDISDYIASNMQDTIARTEGVGDINVFGSQYAMRIWLDPAKLAAYELMPSDITSALSAQNVQGPAGKIGDMPSPDTQELNATVTAQSMLQSVSDFKNIIVKSDRQGTDVRLSQVARVEMGSESYTAVPRLDGHPASGIAIMLAPGANALDTSERVKAVLSDLEKNFPDNYKMAFPKDATPFIKLSILEVVETLIIAIVLVVLIMWLFLQNWRATIIPTISVPVVLLGTFGIMAAMGYSINTLTMFGLVLSIGLLVDDSIVVIENVERLMSEEKMSPRDATILSMKEITSALIGTSIVICAVFLPMAFFSGSTGVIYRQFSVTVISSMLLSVFVALTLTPMLCASLLKDTGASRQTGGFFGWFNRMFDKFADKYNLRAVSAIKRPKFWLAGYVVIIAVMGLLMVKLPSSFLPEEDQGDVMVMFNLPAGASITRTTAIADEIQTYIQEEESDLVDHFFTVSGFSFSGSGQNAGMGFLSLKDWDERTGAGESASDIAGRLMMKMSEIRDGSVIAMLPPVIQGLGQSNGFTFELQAAAGTTRDELTEIKNAILQQARTNPLLSGVREGTLSETPQLDIDIDNEKAVAMGLSLSDVADTLSTAWAGSYVNDFLDRGRVKKVYIEGDSNYSSKPEDLRQWHVRGTDSDGNTTMTPFSAFSSVSWSQMPQTLSRFNGLASYEIQGSAASGVSSGEAMAEMERLADEVGNGKVTYSWSGLSYQENLSGGQSVYLYAISILVVFLALAALYESWSIPFSVMLVIPLGLIGATLAATFRGLENDVYFQVALLTTIGLSAKNAILIVEFAEAAYEKGQSAVDAAIHAAAQRLRPIIMTSLTFVFGIFPLVIASGAGANSRISIGTGILGGTLTATLLAIFFIPMFFVLVRTAFPARKPVYDTAADKE